MTPEEAVHQFLNRPCDPSLLEELRTVSRDAAIAKELFENHQAFQRLLEQRNQVAANKTLANILYHLPDARARLVEIMGVEALAHEVPRSPDAYAEELVFVRLRILFLVTIEPEIARRLLGIKETLLRTAPVAQCQRDPRLRDSLVEVLRILYNLGRIDPAGGVGDFGYACLEASRDLGIVGNSFNVLLGAGHPESCDPEVMFEAFSVLLASLEDPKTRLDASEFLPPACIVLRRMAEGEPESGLRRHLRRKILPSAFDRQSAIDKGPTPRAQLARLFASPDDNLVLCLGDLLLVLVKRQLSRLIYHFGYGILAGFLYARNLLGDLPRAFQRTDDLEGSSSYSSDEEEIRSGALERIDPLSGQVSSRPAGVVEMTEEEREAESQRLFDVLDRMEKSGAVRIIREDSHK